MTPLAHRMVRELTLPKKRRTFVDRCQLLPMMADIHCFEMSDVFPLICQIVDDPKFDYQQAKYEELAESTSFLPAPRTWIEWQDHRRAGLRGGALLVESGGGAHVMQAAGLGDEWGSAAPWMNFAFPLAGRDENPNALAASKDLTSDQAESLGVMALILRVALALINTPRIIGRQQHMPNGALERRLLRHRRDVGHFPLHAWTEIKLQVHAPANLSDDEPVEAHLTGQRALHFCRAHLRIKQGRVEFVRSHWRGDASLGIKRSRYTVTQ